MALINSILESVTLIEAETKNIRYLLNTAQDFNWMPASIIPTDGLYIVCTDRGAIFISQPIGGHWISNVKYWTHLPPLPQDLKK